MDTILCSRCQHEVARDVWEDHTCPLGPRPRLPVAGFLVRVEGDRVTVKTLGPLPFLVLGAQVFCEASFAMEDLGSLVQYLLTQIEEQGE